MLSLSPFDVDNQHLTGDAKGSFSVMSNIGEEKVREDGLVREADPQDMLQLHGGTDHVLPRALRGEEGADEGKGAGAP
nr:hypothetical protein [uncultured Sphingomonas sp.]